MLHDSLVEKPRMKVRTPTRSIQEPRSRKRSSASIHEIISATSRLKRNSLYTGFITDTYQELGTVEGSHASLEVSLCLHTDTHTFEHVYIMDVIIHPI